MLGRLLNNVKQQSRRYAIKKSISSNLVIAKRPGRGQAIADRTAFELVRTRRFLKSQCDAWTRSGHDIVVSEFKNVMAVSGNNIGLACQSGIGDAYLVCSLCSAIKAKYRADHVVVFVREKLAFLPALFPDIDEVVAVPEIVGIKNVGEDTIGLGRIFYAHFRTNAETERMARSGLNLLEWYERLFEVGAGAEIKSPRLPSTAEMEEAYALLRRYDLAPGKTCILCPDAVSTAQGCAVPENLWQSLCVKLLERKTSVATNMGPGGKPISGSVALPVPLELFRAVSMAAGIVIANRSGICDLISDLPIDLKVIYPKMEWHGVPLLEAASLKKMGISCAVDEIEIDKEANIEEAVIEILRDKRRSTVGII